MRYAYYPVDGSFIFWEDLKAYAEAYALSTRPLPLDNAAFAWLKRHLRLAFIGERVPNEAFDYYFRELDVMVKRLRQQRVVEKAASLIRDPF